MACKCEDGMAVALRSAPAAVAGMEVSCASLDGTVRAVPALPLAGASGAEDTQNWWVDGWVEFSLGTRPGSETRWNYVSCLFL